MANESLQYRTESIWSALRLPCGHAASITPVDAGACKLTLQPKPKRENVPTETAAIACNRCGMVYFFVGEIT